MRYRLVVCIILVESPDVISQPLINVDDRPADGLVIQDYLPLPPGLADKGKTSQPVFRSEAELAISARVSKMS